ncbi:MAG: DUF2335 domain-containing protein [Armatimonadetes bacterium]|nr:DUF2335 domain-containing protein [Armatimonadota bacterium]
MTSRRKRNPPVPSRPTEKLPPPNPEPTQSPVAHFQLEHFAGPIPPPQLLKAFDLVQPGFAERIVKMAESQMEHRMSLEKMVIQGDHQRANCGLGLAFTLSMAFLAVSYLLVRDGHEVAGGVLGTVDLVGLASAFIYGTKQRREERERKAEQLTRK